MTDQQAVNDLGAGPMKCHACGRALSNDPMEDNFGLWTTTGPRWPYCAPTRWEEYRPDDDPGWCQKITEDDHRAVADG